MEIINLTSPKGTEKCVVCGKDTGVPVVIPVELRNNYSEGQGQLCFGCANKFNLVPVAISPAEESFGLPYTPSTAF